MDERWGVSIEFAMGSFATGSSQQQVRPCPLCPDGDQSLQRKEMSRWAKRDIREIKEAANLDGLTLRLQA
jgi:hypothetical protein